MFGIHHHASNDTPWSAGNEKMVDGLLTELDHLERHYGKYLCQDHLLKDVCALSDSIESYLRGSAEAGSYLRENGTALLDNIKDKLKASIGDVQRFDDESPAASRFSGGKADRLNEAIQVTEKAKEELAKVVPGASRE